MVVKILLILGIAIILITAVFVYGNQILLKQECEKYPYSYKCTTTSTTPTYSQTTGYSDSSGGHACSKPIKSVSYTLDYNGKSINFNPVDWDEARLFCYATYVIEYKGKLTVLQKPEVLDLISHYQYKDVSIKALEFKYIQDKDFVNRLLPQNKGQEIGCIIVLETPNEKRVYLEDEKLQTFKEFAYKVFEQNLNSVSETDRQLFLNNLK